MNSPRDLEEELRQALKREYPSAGFSGRVMARLERKRRNTLRAWMAIAAMLTAGAFITTGVREQVHERELREHATAERAAHELTIALKITGKKLQAARMQIRRRSNGA